MTDIWSEADLATAVAHLKKGDVVAFPTETVYGLGAVATNEEAVRKIFQAKGRPSDNPLIIHVSSREQVADYVQTIPEKARQVMEHFWPGPCTIILEKKGPLALSVTGGLSTVGVRMPNHPVALKLIEAVGLPLAAPSANSSGKPSPTSAEHVKRDLDGKIAGIIDGGQTGVGLESTVLDLTDPKNPMILRPGGVSQEELEKVIGKVGVDTHLSNPEAAPKSPGMKYRHYSPEKPVWILPSSVEESQAIMSELEAKGEKVGIIASEDHKKVWDTSARLYFSIGQKSNPDQAASLLYQAMRELDDSDVTIILAEAYEEKGIGTAYMNRLGKAAEKRI